MKCMDLEFDHYGLKTAQYIFTMDYKVIVIYITIIYNVVLNAVIDWFHS